MEQLNPQKKVPTLIIAFLVVVFYVLVILGMIIPKLFGFLFLIALLWAGLACAIVHEFEK